MTPIIFTASEIALILTGRKTQVRRLATSPLSHCQCGDTLWVRESHSRQSDHVIMRDGWRQYHDGRGQAGGAAALDNSFARRQWRQAVHLPRTASRVTLIVKALRIEPLQSITRGDVHSEGLRAWPIFWQSSFKSHWDSARSTLGEVWADNPIVVAVTFRTAALA